MTYNPFRETEPESEAPAVDPKDTEIAALKDQLESLQKVAFSRQETAQSLTKQLTLLKERMGRAFDGHLHPKRDECTDDCPRRYKE